MSAVPAESAPSLPLAELRGVSKDFQIRLAGGRRARLQANDQVDLTVPAHATVGVVGESGSGKSTAGRLLLRLTDPTAGQVFFDGKDVTQVRGRALREVRHRMQPVFQDPYSSFDPTASIAASLEEALRDSDVGRSARPERVGELLSMVGLADRLRSRRPRELSGGQLQRVAIARALAKSPSLIVLDEPVSSLDASTRAQVLELLGRLQAEYGISYLLIAHDLDMVRDISQDIVVMYLARVVETGPAKQVLTSPRHPYTQALMSAVPRLTARSTGRPERITLRGEIPSPLAPPTGCRFHTRCPRVMDVCRSQDPVPVRQDRVTVACHLYSPPDAGPMPIATRPPTTDNDD